MKVELIAITKPIKEGLNTAEDVIVHNARVSNPNNQMNVGTGGGLLRYCMKHKHFSVFEMANMVLEIHTTRDISRQILRHRSFAFQEFSQRYSEVTPDIVWREVRLQDTKNKQNSILCDNPKIADEFYAQQEDTFNEAIKNYKAALSVGIAKEQARALLPEGLTQTTMYMNGTIRSWIHFVQVRCGIETQKECRLIAKEVCKTLIAEFPTLEEMLTPCLADDYSAEV